MTKKLLKIKKAIEQLEEIDKLTLDARKTIKLNREYIKGLKEELSWKKHNNSFLESIASTQNRIDDLRSESIWNREWIKEVKVEKQDIKNTLKVFLK